VAESKNIPQAAPVTPAKPAPPLPTPTAPHVYVEKGLGIGTIEKR
jgi:hypothetical protein